MNLAQVPQCSTLWLSLECRLFHLQAAAHVLHQIFLGAPLWISSSWPVPAAIGLYSPRLSLWCQWGVGQVCASSNFRSQPFNSFNMWIEVCVCVSAYVCRHMWVFINFEHAYLISWLLIFDWSGSWYMPADTWYMAVHQRHASGYGFSASA